MSNPRIISGSAKGIRLEAVPRNITRPIMDKVKEALFNIIGADIQNSKFLDLFGGTGSVGIEALSRGASFVRFIDLNPIAAKVIKNNLIKTKLSDHADVLCVNALRYLQSMSELRFDYVYVAPPQYKKTWITALQNLDNNPIHLSKDAWVIVQIDPIENEEFELKNMRIFDKRSYGNTMLLFLNTKS